MLLLRYLLLYFDPTTLVNCRKYHELQGTAFTGIRAVDGTSPGSPQVYSAHNSLVSSNTVLRFACRRSCVFPPSYPSFLLDNLGVYSIRSPGPVSPEDVECEGFDITYTRIAGDKTSSSHHHRGTGGVASPPAAAAAAAAVSLENDIHVKVDHAIEGFLKNLSQIGPELLSVSSDFSVAVPPLMIDHHPVGFLGLLGSVHAYINLAHFSTRKNHLRNLPQGCLTLSFFERRASRQLFGLMSHEERVV